MEKFKNIIAYLEKQNDLSAEVQKELSLLKNEPPSISVVRNLKKLEENTLGIVVPEITIQRDEFFVEGNNGTAKI
jgi:hypothetical protein